MKPLAEELPEIVDWLLSLGGWPRTERRLARLVVELVEEKIGPYSELDFKRTLADLHIDPAKFQELKRRVEESDG